MQQSHHLHEEREQERATLNGLVASVPLGITILDEEMRYRMVNGPLVAVNGVPAEGHIGRTVAEVVPDIAPHVEPIFHTVMKSGQAVASTAARPWPWRTRRAMAGGPRRGAS